MNKEILTLILAFYYKIEEQQEIFQNTSAENGDRKILEEIKAKITGLTNVLQQLERSLYYKLKHLYKRNAENEQD